MVLSLARLAELVRSLADLLLELLPSQSALADALLSTPGLQGGLSVSISVPRSCRRAQAYTTMTVAETHLKLVAGALLCAAATSPAMKSTSRSPSRKNSDSGRFIMFTRVLAGFMSSTVSFQVPRSCNQPLRSNSCSAVPAVPGSEPGEQWHTC